MGSNRLQLQFPLVSARAWPAVDGPSVRCDLPSSSAVRSVLCARRAEMHHRERAPICAYSGSVSSSCGQSMARADGHPAVPVAHLVRAKCAVRGSVARQLQGRRMGCAPGWTGGKLPWSACACERAREGAQVPAGASQRARRLTVLASVVGTV